MYSTVQFTPENIAAIKSIPGVKYCSAGLDNLIPFDGLSLFPGTVPIAEQYQQRTKTMGVCNSADEEGNVMKLIPGQTPRTIPAM